jgi:hypothetical protein
MSSGVKKITEEEFYDILEKPFHNSIERSK